MKYHLWVVWFAVGCFLLSAVMLVLKRLSGEESAASDQSMFSFIGLLGLFVSFALKSQEDRIARLEKESATRRSSE